MQSAVFLLTFLQKMIKRVNEEILKKVYSDKDRQASEGFDGTMVMHPALGFIYEKSF